MVKRQRVAVILTILVVAGLSGAAGYLISQLPALGAPPTIATQPPSKHRQIGGVSTEHESEEKTQSDQSSPATSSQLDTKPSAAAAPAPTTSISETERVAPKQAAIARQITTEHTYRALQMPNDPLVTYNEWQHATVKSTAAWQQSTGSPVIVAVIDTGFALEHEDLVNQWHINPGEDGLDANDNQKRSNGIDDDSNGYVDDWQGWDFIGNKIVPDNNVQAGSTNPTGAAVAHGTASAGLAGATSNNGRGIATLNWGTKIMPLQVLTDDGVGSTSGVVAAIYYAVDNGAKIINLSLGGDYQDEALSEAIKYAYGNNVLVIAAAGNCGEGCVNEAGDIFPPGTMSYPALDQHVVAVGAIDSNLERAGFSSYGPGLDIAAPGSGTLYSTYWSSTNGTSLYAASLYGTSFAAPIVSSLASLVMSQRPNADIADITAILMASAQKPASLNGELYTEQLGHGIIDADYAVRVAQKLTATPSPTATLLQTGSNISEHTFASTSLISSGCRVADNTYCTVVAHNNHTGNDRYLPYALTASDGRAGWSWKGSTLGAGDWDLYARSGNVTSSQPYQLFQK